MVKRSGNLANNESYCISIIELMQFSDHEALICMTLGADFKYSFYKLNDDIQNTREHLRTLFDTYSFSH